MVEVCVCLSITIFIVYAYNLLVYEVQWLLKSEVIGESIDL